MCVMFNDAVASHPDGFHDVLQHIVDVTLDYFVDDTLVNAYFYCCLCGCFLCCLSNMF